MFRVACGFKKKMAKMRKLRKWKIKERARRSANVIIMPVGTVESFPPIV